MDPGSSWPTFCPGRRWYSAALRLDCEDGCVEVRESGVGTRLHEFVLRFGAYSERDGAPASGCVCKVQQMIVHAVWRFFATGTEATRLGGCSQDVCAFVAPREGRGGHFKSRN